MISISGQITQICLHGIVIHLSCLCFVLCSYTKTDPKMLLSWGKRLFRGEGQQKTHLF